VRAFARVLVALSLLAACESVGADREAVLEALAPHAERFEAFDAWARRTVIAEPRAPASRAFAETLFAPLRGDDAVLDAWVTREGTSPRTWRMHGEPPDVELTSVRAPRFGSVRAGLGTIAPRGARVDVVVIERRKDETASTQVVVAVVCVVMR
jgi:hypothetical protein